MRKNSVCVVLLLCAALPLLAAPIKLFETGKELQYHENWYGAIELYQQALKENPAYMFLRVRRVRSSDRLCRKGAPVFSAGCGY